MADKILNTRIQLKYDTLTNWQTKNTLLKQGEVAFVQIGEVTVDNKGNRVIPPVMFKVGPGNFNDLGWGAATAADVYSWAKQDALPVVRNDAEGQTEGNVISSISWDSENNRVIYTTASVATSEGMAGLQAALEGLTNTVNGMYTNEQIDEAIENAINALSADGGAIKAVADDLAAHEQAFSDFQTTNTKAISDAVAAEAEIARAAEKANADAIDAIEADYLKAADLNDYAKTADVPNIKVNSAATADKVANALTVGSKTFDGSAAVEVTASDLGLESAMHFIGALSAAPDTAKPGDVYLNTATKKEYVYDETNGWVELGDEGSYALRTITITGTDGLTGGGDLTENRTIGLSEATKASLAKADSALQEHQDISGKADKVSGATNGNLAGLDATGNLTDSGVSANNVALLDGFGNYIDVDGDARFVVTANQGTGIVDWTVKAGSNVEITAPQEGYNNEITISAATNITTDYTGSKENGVSGIKATKDETDGSVNVEIDDTITFIFDCGGAE